MPNLLSLLLVRSEGNGRCFVGCRVRYHVCEVKADIDLSYRMYRMCQTDDRVETCRKLYVMLLFGCK
jgi:hypothetical protein